MEIKSGKKGEYGVIILPYDMKDDRENSGTYE